MSSRPRFVRDIECSNCKRKEHTSERCNFSNNKPYSSCQSLYCRDERRPLGSPRVMERIVPVQNQLEQPDCKENIKKKGLLAVKELDLGGLKESFPTLFEQDKQMRYCEVDKSSIPTKVGCRVVRKGQMVPQMLKSKTKEYLEDLERRGVIRRSNSD